MKTTQLLVACLCWLAALTAQAQDRGSVWVHGLGSNSAGEWAQWQNLFTNERQLNNLSRGNFDTDQGINGMANQVRSTYGGDSRTIFFGKSMGGVVGRELDVNQNGSFGGIITAGSPLDGARIANSVRSGEATNAVEDGVNAAIEGPRRQLGIVAYVVSGIVINDQIRKLTQTANSFVSNNFTQGPTDLAENSGYMNSGIRNAQTGTAKLLVYGNEESPVHWRIASQLFFDNDDDLVGYMRTAGDVYDAAMWVNYGLAAASGVFTFGLSAIYFVWVADGWSQGMNWIRYDSERVWNNLIGAGTPSTNTVCSTQIDWNGFNQCMSSLGHQATYQDYQNCQQQNSSQYCYTYYASVNGQSDAFIKAPSQTGYNSAWANTATRIEARGANHLEMRKHPRMEQIYRGVFEGNVDGQSIDPFFSTARR